MRDLTEQELALAPEWATHYNFCGGVLTFSSQSRFESYCTFSRKFIDGDSCTDGNTNFVEADDLPIHRKPFDITQHEWSDGDINSSFVTNDKKRLNFTFDSSVIPSDVIGFNKSDAIAIAKHFKLTSKDLK